jgi:hypothetical protein
METVLPSCSTVWLRDFHAPDWLGAMHGTHRNLNRRLPGGPTAAILELRRLNFLPFIPQACLTEYGLAQVEEFLVKVIL